jgi:hypothetical protein
MTVQPISPIDLESRIVVQAALLVMALLALITLSRMLHPAEARPLGEPGRVVSEGQRYRGE